MENHSGRQITLYVFIFLSFRLNMYEGGSESSVIGVITLLIYMIGCCIIP